LEKEQLNDALEDLGNHMYQAMSNLRDLQNKVEEARKQWTISQETLLAKHAELTAASFAEKYATISKLE